MSKSPSDTSKQSDDDSLNLISIRSATDNTIGSLAREKCFNIQTDQMIYDICQPLNLSNPPTRAQVLVKLLHLIQLLKIKLEHRCQSRENLIEMRKQVKEDEANKKKQFDELLASLNELNDHLNDWLIKKRANRISTAVEIVRAKTSALTVSPAKSSQN